MLNITKVAPDRINFDITGQIDAVEMATGLDQLVAETATMAHGKMLYRITGFEMPTLGALAVELGRLPSVFLMLGKIDRCALICETNWIRSAATLEGRIIPSLEVKAFTPDQADAAEAWLEGRDTQGDDSESHCERVPV